jgi:hypothetical protein
MESDGLENRKKKSFTDEQTEHFVEESDEVDEELEGGEGLGRGERKEVEEGEEGDLLCCNPAI